MNFNHDAIVPPDPIFLKVGGFSVYWYAIFILTGIVIALCASIREGKKKGLDAELFIDLVGMGLPICIVGARLYYVLFNLDWFLQHPGRILAINEGGLAIHGGIIAGVLYGTWYLKRKRIPVLPLFDIAAVGFFIGQIIGRFGNFMNQEAYGGVINGSNLDTQREFLTGLLIPEWIVNGMFINGNYHHPTFLYEALWNLVGLLLAVFVLRRLSKLLVGEIAAFYAIWYSFGRMFIEGLRTDSLMLGSLRVAQVISIVTLVVVVTLVVLRRKNEKAMIAYLTFNFEDDNQAKKQRKKKQKRVK